MQYVYCNELAPRLEQPPYPFLDIQTVNEKLLQLALHTGYDCIQKNGQRCYGPPPNWTGPPPERGSEVFIGRLPRDCFEDEIVPFLESVSRIYELRLMMNFTGFNRGYAFVTFFNKLEAWRIIQFLHETEIRPGCSIAISKSMDNCRLYIGGLPTDKSKADALEELVKISPNVKDVIMYPDHVDRSKNRGFLFAEYDNHRLASMAKRYLAQGMARMWDKSVVVDWADPEPEVDPAVMHSITKLFVRNLTDRADSEFVRKLLCSVVPTRSIERIYINGNYAFLHFDTRFHAEIAKELLSTVVIHGEELEVNWARPRCFKKNNKLAQRMRKHRKPVPVPVHTNQLPAEYTCTYCVPHT